MRLRHFFRILRHSEWTPRVLGLAFLALVCIGAYWAGVRRRDGHSATGGLYIAPGFLDFGEVWAQKEFKWALEVQNKGEHHIEIAGWKSSCGCTSATPAAITLTPGASARVQFTLDLLPARPYSGTSKHRERSGTTQVPVEGPVPTRRFAFDLYPQIRDRAWLSPAWTVHGVVREPLKLSQPRINFGETLVRGRPPGSMTIDVTLTHGVNLLGVTDRRQPSSVTLELIEASQGSAKLKVTPVRTLPAGRFSAEATLALTTTQGQRLPEIVVPIEGTVLEDVRAIPSALDIGVVSVGQAGSAPLTLWSSSQQPFTATPILPLPPGLTLRQERATSSGRTVWSVTVVPTESGPRKATIAFLITVGEEDRFTVGVEVSFCGIELG